MGVKSGFSSHHKKALDKIRLFTGSEIRIKVLMALNGGSKDLTQLKKSLGHDSSTIIHAMESMRVDNLIEVTKGGYTLTNIGKAEVILLNNLLKSVSALSKKSEFWLTHDISGIPDHLLKRIGDLNDCEVLVSPSEDILRVFSNYFRLVLKAKEVKGVSPIFHPDLPDLIKALVNRKADVELVLTQKVMAKAKKTCNCEFKKMVHDHNLRLWLIDEDVKVAFTVTDSALSFGLFLNDGKYDMGTDLITYGGDAIGWGRDLFKYYQMRAREVNPEDI